VVPLKKSNEKTSAGKSTPSKISMVIAKAVQSGSPLSEINKIDPGFFMLNLQKISAYHTFCLSQATREPIMKWNPLPPHSDPTGPTQKVIDWLNLNIQSKRPFKQKQLYLYGPVNSGKTTLSILLTKYCQTYTVPMGEDYYDFYTDPEPTLCVMDEFKGQKTIEWLNAFLQGAPMMLRRRQD
jgi:hypothetical protein